jgi:hypothetical protein
MRTDTISASKAFIAVTVHVKNIFTALVGIVLTISMIVNSETGVCDFCFVFDSDNNNRFMCENTGHLPYLNSHGIEESP